MTASDAFVLQYLANAAWLSVLIGVGAAALLFQLRAASPHLRYRLGIIALLLSAMMPAVTPWLVNAATLRWAARVEISAGAPTTLKPEAAGPSIVSRKTADLICLAYAAAISVSLGRICVGSIRVARLRRRTIILQTGPLVDQLAARCAEWRLPPIALGISDAARTPLLCGIWSPLIVLPVSMTSADPAVLDVVLAHELAHAARRDLGQHAALELATLPVAWHPVVMGLKRLIARYREQSCDEAAIAQLQISRRRYAERLVEIAGALAGARGDAASMTFGAQGSLEARVRAILSPPRANPGPRRLATFAALVLVTTAIVFAMKGFRVTVGARGWEILAGVWELDMNRSQAPLPYRSARLEIAVVDDGLRIAQEREMLEGRLEQFTYVTPTDLTPFDIVTPSGQVVSGRAYWSGTRLVTDIALPGGEVEHSEVTARGNELLVAVTRRNARGEMSTHRVWTRQSDPGAGRRR